MDQSKKSDLDAMVIRFINGESELLQRIMELLRGPVYSFFLGLEIPAADAPDVVEQFFYDLFDRKIWRYKHRSGSTFWSWLCVVIVNTAKDWHRAEARRPEIAASDFLERADERSALVQERVTPPSERMRTVLEAFQEAFAQLSAAEQDLLRLKEVAELEYEEIAEIFRPGIDAEERKRLVNSLKTQFHRAKEKIRKLMEPDLRVPRSFFEDRSKRSITA